MTPLPLLKEKEQALQKIWVTYLSAPDNEGVFLEFILALNNLSDILSIFSLSGPLLECQRLEKECMGLLGQDFSRVASDGWLEPLAKRVGRFIFLLQNHAQKSAEFPERRVDLRLDTEDDPLDDLLTPIYLISAREDSWHELTRQLGYFGFSVQQPDRTMEVDEVDMSVYLLDLAGIPEHEWLERLRRLRELRPVARIICLSTPGSFSALNQALKAGADYCLPPDASPHIILENVLGHRGEFEQESYRVLVVEDSRTAAYAICRNLENNGITAQVLPRPEQALEVIRQFSPDLVLMDMYMPGYTGVEVARVIRLHEEFLSIPIVYLSSETNVALQVEALRLGGDQFLTKPFHPMLMNAVIKSKIDRYRILRRSMQTDSLTGLLNHITSKQALAEVIRANENNPISIVMMDIDHFKWVNDEHGHVMGDQVIRSLSWLLKQRLRRSDIIGRYGGEEFVAGLVGAKLEDTDEIINRIREDFSRISFKDSEGLIFRVTLSAGVAVRSSKGETLDTLLESADSALYIAKRGGRNRVVFHAA